MKGVQLFGLFFTLIGSANAAFTVDASHSKTKDVTIKGFTKQGKPDEMKFKAGETILVKGIGLGLSHTVLLDVIKIDAINKKMRWWSSPSVTSGKTSGTITGKDSLADHLNALKKGWQKRKDKEPKKVDGNWAWVEKLGQTSKALYKENDTPSYADGSKPGAGSAGSIDPALKSKFPIPETKSAHQGFNYMMNEFNNDYDRRQGTEICFVLL